MIDKLSSPRNIISYGVRLGVPLMQMLRFTKWIRVISSPYKYISRKIYAKKVMSNNFLTTNIDKGYMKFHLDELPGVNKDNILNICNEIIKNKNNIEKHKKNKPYLIVVTEPDDFIKYPELLSFALNEKLTMSIAKYLDTVPVLVNIRIWVCPPNNTDDQGSQLFHVDQEDTKQIKLFVNLNEITMESGPLSFIPAHASMKARMKLDKPLHRVNDKIMYSIVNENELTSFVGEPGEVMGVDTSRCYHYGGRKAQKSRHLLVLQYVSYHEIMETPAFIKKEAFDNINLSKWQKKVLPQHDYNYIK